jgi:hypothetical protein
MDTCLQCRRRTRQLCRLSITARMVHTNTRCAQLRRRAAHHHQAIFNAAPATGSAHQLSCAAVSLSVSARRRRTDLLVQAEHILLGLKAARQRVHEPSIDAEVEVAVGQSVSAACVRNCKLQPLLPSARVVGQAAELGASCRMRQHGFVLRRHHALVERDAECTTPNLFRAPTRHDHNWLMRAQRYSMHTVPTDAAHVDVHHRVFSEALACAAPACA